jgi:hypothetical protein
MWRIWLSFAALVALAIPLAVLPTQAAHPSRATCGERDSVLCSLYRGSPDYSGPKLARSHPRRHAKQPTNADETSSNGGSAHATRPAGGKAAATATPAKLLAARSFDPLASGSDSGELTAPAPLSTAEPWLKSVLIALGAGGILSMFLAKAAEL